ncbi:hypothetical protein AVEN_259459-1 [Araneus ventricosus]|uniref:Uncharacterized protein n=1 Tax=Araneus ventricosus TaxID=182803 RepID=A0A4Y2I337_ARAVE|nr:hypothetical protein AVEN_259459-1 [Araneus ventricosus]
MNAGSVAGSRNLKFCHNLQRNRTSPRFPLNIMLSDFDDDSGCMAFWSCSDFGSSMVQKGGWVMCQSLDVDQEVVEKLADNLANTGNITASDFAWTKYDSCL